MKTRKMTLEEAITVKTLQEFNYWIDEHDIDSEFIKGIVTGHAGRLHACILYQILDKLRYNNYDVNDDVKRLVLSEIDHRAVTILTDRGIV